MVESNIEKEGFLAQHTDFSLREQVLYPNGGKSCFYDNGIDISSISEVVKIHEQGAKRRQDTETELVKVEQELKQALLEAGSK